MSEPGSSRIVVLLVYVAAVAAGIIGWSLTADHDPRVAALSADVFATLVVFLGSVLFSNASVYDPYWSVAPPLLLAGWMVGSGQIPGPTLLAFGVLLVWSIRLTANWVRRWKGLSDEDFRYTDLRRQWEAWYPIVNLAGIHMLPTLLVLAACLPLYTALTDPLPLSWTDGLAATVCLGAVLLQTVADRQLRRFRMSRSAPGAGPPIANEDRGRIADPATEPTIIAERDPAITAERDPTTTSDGRPTFLRTGVWSRMRHPNYLGEILFWWGVGLFAVRQVGFEAFSGAVIMTALFQYISVPMMTARLRARYPGYGEHVEQVPALFPRLW